MWGQPPPAVQPGKARQPRHCCIVCSVFVFGPSPRGLAERLREQKLLSPQLLNRIPQLRSFFKLKPLRRFAHVALKLDDISIQLRLRLELRDALSLAASQVG